MRKASQERRTPAQAGGVGLARLGHEDGQSAVELVALLPLALVLALGAFMLLSAQAAGEQAAAAAQAGAMALLQDSDPRTAARDALPEAARDRAAIRVTGRRVTVRVRPAAPLAALTRSLTATSTADAGPPR